MRKGLRLLLTLCGIVVLLNCVLAGCNLTLSKPDGGIENEIDNPQEFDQAFAGSNGKVFYYAENDYRAIKGNIIKEVRIYDDFSIYRYYEYIEGTIIIYTGNVDESNEYWRVSKIDTKEIEGFKDLNTEYNKVLGVFSELTGLKVEDCGDEFASHCDKQGEWFKGKELSVIGKEIKLSKKEMIIRIEEQESKTEIRFVIGCEDIEIPKGAKDALQEYEETR